MAYSQIRQANGPLEDELAPSPHRSIPRTGTLHDHVQESLRYAVINNQFEGPLANIPSPVVEIVAMQGYPQDPLYIDEAHYDMSVPVGYYYHHPQPGDPTVSYVYNDAGVARDIPVQQQAIQVQVSPEIQGNNDFGSVPQHLAPGPPRAEFSDLWTHHAPVRDYPQVVQVDRVVRMEPGHARRFKVVITLEMPDVF
ncbi:hypothetical protein BGW80DRAFT_1562290 [Lactifluus volemus]|nr:hypothetical protein BGW80DRAFT_1562290 [Lactifluus volemus]